MREPLVSVIIPTIDGREKSFERAVKSVMHQTHQRIEIIPIRNIKNPGEARNLGIQKANGDYIAFLDDDDEFLPDKIEKQLEIITQKQTLLVVCWIDDRRFRGSVIVEYPEKISQKQIMEMFNLASTSAYLFDAKFLKEYQNFDERFLSAQEYDLAIRSSYPSSVYCLQQVGAIQYQSENQITRDWKKKRDGLKMLLKKHKTIYKSYGITTYVCFRFKFIGLHLLYLSAEIFGDRVYRIIIPMKKRRK